MVLVKKLMINDKFVYYCILKSSVMKTKTTILFVLTLVTLGLFGAALGQNIEEPWVKAVLVIVPIIFVFNFSVRTNMRFKGYFTSKYNFLNSKYNAVITSDLSKELMYQKMVEVIENSPLKLVEANDVTQEILSTRSVTWTSWGENIYIDFSIENGVTQMNFISTTVVGVVSWGKNEKNYNRLLSIYEESLTI